ncbi:MAG: SDR family oxidoreductase [Actinobacteria bacterium]|nr:SDR family oxidoreductase [Actinomycetota bacterium]
MADKRWTEADNPDLTGQTAVVTGASAGLGLQIARVLADQGAHVVLACRNVDKAEAAADRIGGSTAVIQLDLASLGAVRSAADEIRAAYPQLDLLINNAGVMEVPYERTVDGFELTFATNHLGHFALTGLLLDRLLAAPGARIVTMSSMAHLDGTMDFDDLQGERGYNPERAYAQSKLANLLFTFELDRRLRAAGVTATALGAHPGVVYTDLFRTRSPWQQAVLKPRFRVVNFWAVQDVRMGALPALRAATDASASGGDYFGPRRYGLLRWFYTGYPARVEPSERARNSADQARLWQVSEQLTGVTYALP